MSSLAHLPQVEEEHSSIGILRICAETNQGMRKYMEDEVSVVIEKDDRNIAFLGVFDGHGGKEASVYARDNLYPNLKKQAGFYDADPEKVKAAIREGFIATHWEMFREVETWPKRKDGQNSTSGTTATVAIIRGQKLYIAHVGDSAAVLAGKKDDEYVCTELTVDHKPESVEEKSRIENLGGRVARTNGVPRVVWKRAVKVVSPVTGQPTSTRFEYVPFLAVSRALGDLWSYDSDKKEFIVSPEPEIESIDLIPGHHKFILLASDGLWGVMNGQQAVDIVAQYENNSSLTPKKRNCSVTLIRKSLDMWHKMRSRADNISAVVAFFDDEFDSCQSTVINEAEADTDVAVSDIEDDTPPMSKASSTSSLVRQIAFCTSQSTYNNKVSMDDVSSKLKIPTVTAAASSNLDAEVSPTHDTTTSGKRKLYNETNATCSCEKKIRTASPVTLNTDNGDSHQCPIITVLSPESLCDLQLDEDLGYADDESEEETSTEKIKLRKPCRNPLAAQSLIPVVQANQS